MTSPGRWAVPLIEFSATATSPVTGMSTPSSASAPIAAITTPPPVMSRFIVIIASPGLSDRPPVSKVIPCRPAPHAALCRRASGR
jgi:hypothetical protein